jgi:hypothetical protein
MIEIVALLGLLGLGTVTGSIFLLVQVIRSDRH